MDEALKRIMTVEKICVGGSRDSMKDHVLKNLLRCLVF